jgi:hypothetical protein
MEGTGKGKGVGGFWGNEGVIEGVTDDSDGHAASSLSEQVVGSSAKQLVLAMAPQHEKGAGLGQGVQSPSRRSAG